MSSQMTARKQSAKPSVKLAAKPAPKSAPKSAPTPMPEDPEEMSPLLLTVDRAAQKLGICRDFMYRLLARGEMRSVKIGRSRRVPVGELEAYIARRLSEVA